MSGSAASTYDAWAEVYDRVFSYLTEDIPFYVEEAVRSGGPVLEAGCGTGRVALAMAEAGVEVVGIDISPAMLRVAQHKLRARRELRGRVSFLRRDMASFNLRRRFSLIVTPFRSFQALLSVAEQRRALEAFRRHLAPGGRLIVDAFVPNLEILVNDPSILAHLRDTPDPLTGGKLVMWHQSYVDPFTQVLDVRQVIEAVDPQGHMLGRFYRDFQMRYTFRYEFQHLLELCGFQIEALYGDFQRTPFDESSREQVWVAGLSPGP